jgi:hypothetical protein
VPPLVAHDYPWRTCQANSTTVQDRSPLRKPLTLPLKNGQQCCLIQVKDRYAVFSSAVAANDNEAFGAFRIEESSEASQQ